MLFADCRGLFEKHKLVFSFMLCADIMRQAGDITDAEWNYFLRGAAGVDKVSVMNTHLYMHIYLHVLTGAT